MVILKSRWQTDYSSLRRAAVTIVYLTIVTIMTACGAFVVRQPDPDVHEILVLRNDNAKSVSTFSKYLIEPQPQPLPLISESDFDDLIRRAQPPALRPSTDVPSIDVRPNEVTASPPGQVVTQQTNYSLDPMRASGQFNFTKATGSTGYCSAQFVGNTGVILTAAHCVFDGRFGNGSSTGWIADAEFAHGSGGPNPAHYDWACIGIYKGWALDNPAFDYAFVKLAGNGPLALGLRPSLFQSQRATSGGYPSNISDHFISYVNGIPQLASASVLQHAPNPFGPGSSGGAWVDTDRAESLNSFGRNNQPNTMFGPIFSARTVELFEYVRNGCLSGSESASKRSDGTSNAQAGVVPTVRDSTHMVRRAFAEVAVLPFQTDVEVAHEPSCSCPDSKPLYVMNSTDAPRRISLAVKRYRADSNISSPDVVLDLGPREQRLVGCNRVEHACEVKQDLRVTTTSRLRTTSRASVAAALATPVPVSIEACVARCNEGDPAWCQRLGGRPSDALMPLAELLKSNSTPANSNGVVLKRDQVISALGGDPSKDKDHCGRSDLVANGYRIANSGGECVIQSKSISNDPSSELALTLHLNSHLSWLKTSREDATFDKVDEEPFVAFVGPDADVLTEAYGGRIHSARIVPEGLVVSTENGCLMAIKR